MPAWDLKVDAHHVRVESHMGLLEHALKILVNGEVVAARTGMRFEPGNRAAARVARRGGKERSIRAATTWTWTEHWLLLDVRVWVDGRRVLRRGVVSSADAHLRVARAALAHARPA